jgi:capsule polysaccharide export protein KpsE/RkpR
MIPANFEDFSFDDLCELLVQKTELLIKALDDHADGHTIRDYQEEVKKIHAMLKQKKADSEE